jgi:hypothetical protein
MYVLSVLSRPQLAEILIRVLGIKTPRRRGKKIVAVEEHGGNKELSNVAIGVENGSS